MSNNVSLPERVLPSIEYGITPPDIEIKLEALQSPKQRLLDCDVITLTISEGAVIEIES